jgi:hypothetical protein
MSALPSLRHYRHELLSHSHDHPQRLPSLDRSDNKPVLASVDQTVTNGARLA